MRSPWTLSKGNGLFSFFSSPSPWCWQWVWDGTSSTTLTHSLAVHQKPNRHEGEASCCIFNDVWTDERLCSHVPMVVLTALCQCHHTRSTSWCLFNRVLSRQMISNTASVFASRVGHETEWSSPHSTSFSEPFMSSRCPGVKTSSLPVSMILSVVCDVFEAMMSICASLNSDRQCLVRLSAFLNGRFLWEAVS